MSRIGLKAVAVPKGVTVEVKGDTVSAKGKVGSLTLKLVPEVSAKLDGGNVAVQAKDESDKARAMWGMTRTLINNMVHGVDTGFSTDLVIEGVGFRAAVEGKNLKMQLGFSHDVIYPIPEGIKITTGKPTEIKVFGADRQKVGQVAADIRAFRPPEPYKGKGIRYSDEHILRKEGKKK
ncbi:MAG: 50S ribosomal protein L6 [Alphaproteobacteria bacterium]|nr:50S ribosomal protein L6 [Alphaproteobacteria bacterium]